MDFSEEKEFCLWLSEQMIFEDDEKILFSEIAHKLVELGYLEPVDIAGLGLCGCM